MSKVYYSDLNMVRDTAPSQVVHVCKVWWSCMKPYPRYCPNKESYQTDNAIPSYVPSK